VSLCCLRQNQVKLPAEIEKTVAVGAEIKASRTARPMRNRRRRFACGAFAKENRFRGRQSGRVWPPDQAQDRLKAGPQFQGPAAAMVPRDNGRGMVPAFPFRAPAVTPRETLELVAFKLEISVELPTVNGGPGGCPTGTEIGPWRGKFARDQLAILGESCGSEMAPCRRRPGTRKSSRAPGSVGAPGLRIVKRVCAATGRTPSRGQ